MQEFGERLLARASVRTGLKRCGFEYVVTCGRASARSRGHRRCAASGIDLPPARPVPLERRHDEIAGPCASTPYDFARELVDGQVVVGERITDRGDHLVGLVRQSSASPPAPGRPGGNADSAPVHNGRSSSGNRCTVPRGPNVFTSRPPAAPTPRVAPSTRSATDTSPAASDLRMRPTHRPYGVHRRLRSGLGQVMPPHPPGNHGLPGRSPCPSARDGSGQLLTSAAARQRTLQFDDGSPAAE